MQYHVVNVDNKQIKQSGCAEDVREHLEDLFYLKFNFNPMLQDNDDDGELEVYLHTDTYDELDEEQLKKLDELGITECDSLQKLCEILTIEIRHFSEKEVASCSICSHRYHEGEVNMVDYDLDVCSPCEPNYKKSINL